MELTLEQYGKQAERFPFVRLQEGEFRIHPPYIKSGHDELALVWVESYSYSYVHKKGDSTLYTQDEDGNIKRPSVFHLPVTYEGAQ